MRYNLTMTNSNNQLSLDDSEEKVYLALLELGPSSVSEITKKAGVTRTLGYYTLDKLGLYGLVERSSGQGKKVVYTAKHPKYLVQYVKNRRNKVERQLKEVEQKIPELVSLYNIADKPTIRYQEGLEGLKNIYSESLESKTEILSIADIDGWDVPELRKWGQDYNRERSKRKIHERILMLDTKVGRDWMKDYKGSYKYTDYRWIKPEQLQQIADFRGEVNVYENKVVIALLKKPKRMGIVIESEVLTNILKSLFELAWQAGEVISKK